MLEISVTYVATSYTCTVVARIGREHFTVQAPLALTWSYSAPGAPVTTRM